MNHIGLPRGTGGMGDEIPQVEQGVWGMKSPN